MGHEGDTTMSDSHIRSKRQQRHRWETTGHEQALEAHREEYGYLDSIFNYASAPMLVWDADYTIVRANRAFERLTGLSLDHIIGNNMANLFPYEQIERSLDLISVTYSGERWESVEIPIVHADGSIRTVLWNSATIFEADGLTPKDTVAQGVDITERKAAEEAMLHAKKASESANKAKSAFLATMSHEIRTPMNAMMGSLTLLGTTQLTDQQQKYIQDCNSSSHILLRVINDILDFSKIEAGRMELVKESLSPARMLESLVNTFACRAEEKQLRLNLVNTGQLPDYILGDRQRFSQIISNLLSNAIKFTAKGEIKLSASTQTSARGIMQLVVSVSDSGVGISSEQHSAIFESFTQLEDFNSQHIAGTGLGLAICKRLVALMDGEITLSSAPGEGSTFTVTIPVTLSEAPAKAKPKKVILGTPRNILLADDEPVGSAIAVALLERSGHTVKAVEDGTAVLEELQRERFDILLTDVSMPHMNGTEVAQIIRSGKREGIDALIPIIAMTAHAFPQDREQFLSCGMNDYIAKPINFDRLLELIEETCGNEARSV